LICAGKYYHQFLRPGRDKGPHLADESGAGQNLPGTKRPPAAKLIF